jgi:oxygen-dependent protoporphyrinogen oxidase
VRALFASPKKPKGLFTLKNGMETLIHALQKQLPINIVFNCPVESIDEHTVQAGGKTWHADKIISALPPPFPAKSLSVVNLAFSGDVLPKKGFGYLVPTQEKQSLLGVVFDSSIFPQQNSCGETRLTAMIRAEESEPLSAALGALHAHLGIKAQPIYSSVYFAKNAIPQFEVGCTYSEGISVDACVLRGKHIAVGPLL